LIQSLDPNLPMLETRTYEGLYSVPRHGRVGANRFDVARLMMGKGLRMVGMMS